MPRASDAVRARVMEMRAEGKTSKEIALETGLSPSGILRMAKRLTKPHLQVEEQEEKSGAQAEEMDPNKAQAFLTEIWITGPASSLRNDVLKPSNPLKNNPNALRIAEALMAPQPRLVPQAQAQPQPQETVVEEKEDTALLISRIQMNVENFGPLLGNILKPDADAFLQSLYTKSAPELAMLLRVIEKTRLVGNLTNQLKNMFWMGSSAIELGTQLVGVRSQGLTQALKTQEVEVAMILKEIAMEQADALTLHQRPEVRLAFLVSTTLLSVDTMNRRRIGDDAVRPPPAVPREVKETYKDL